MDSVAAILLAAGRSERMGAFKPLLPFGDSSVIKSCLNYLRRGGIDQIVVVLGHRPEEIRRHLSAEPVDFVVNEQAGSEMSVSIACAVRALPGGAKATLIALADYPAISPSVIARLRQEWENGRRLIIPTWQDRGGHPVLVDLSFRDQLLNLDSSKGLKSLFEAHPDEVVRQPVNCPYVARDLDTWDDYISLYRDVIGTEPPGAAWHDSN